MTTTPSREADLAKFRAEWQKEVRERRKEPMDLGESTSNNANVRSFRPGASMAPKAQQTLAAAASKNLHDNEEPSQLDDEDGLKSSTEELVQSVAQLDLNFELELIESSVNNADRKRRAPGNKLASDPKIEEQPVENIEASTAETKNDVEEGSLGRAERALKIYEAAVEKEKIGQLADALKFYRQAFKLDETVDKLYKNKHFPSNLFSNPQPTPSKKVTTSSLPTAKTSSLLSEYSELEAHPEDEELPCPLTMLPNEITSKILRMLALGDLNSFTKTTYTCRKLAYLAYSDQKLWRNLCMKEYPRMAYEEEVDEEEAVRLWNDSWRQMFLERPRVQFNGIYISICNYHRPGLAETWSTPFHIVTYYRYVRFFDGGTCILHLTTREPIEVVPEFHRTMQRRGIFKGTWKMSMDGRLRIESQAPVAKYLFLQELDIKSSGRGRHNRLNWVGFWSFNRLTEERMEFALKHDKPFYFSRVLSYEREGQKLGINSAVQEETVEQLVAL
ncbi:hypothetical protein V1514DRAFT_290646 [Lipomyces japonicus]|uniref:uncharacterized protein n=1 Tax=Lipomyces japonicus TaxID=56871 RepID=UPI0034CEF85E